MITKKTFLLPSFSCYRSYSSKCIDFRLTLISCAVLRLVHCGQILELAVRSGKPREAKYTVRNETPPIPPQPRARERERGRGLSLSSRHAIYPFGSASNIRGVKRWRWQRDRARNSNMLPVCPVRPESAVGPLPGAGCADDRGQNNSSQCASDVAT